MGDVVLDEVFLIILFLVKPDHARNAKLLKYLYVLFRVVPVPLISVSLLYRPHERHKFTRNNPVHIAIFYSLIELVFFHVEGPEIIPLELDGVLEPLQTLQHGALVEAVALARVPVRLEQAVVGAEHVPGLLGGAFQDDDHEGTHEECPIYHFVRLVRSAIMEDSIVGVILVAQQPCELPRIPVDHRQVQGSEIFVEWEVCQVVVDVEEKCILVILRWLCTGDPVKFIC